LPKEKDWYRQLPEGEKLFHDIQFKFRDKVNNLGRSMKLADIEDNLDITGINDLTEKYMARLQRYLCALRELKSTITSKFVIDINQCKCHLVLPKEKRDA
jgi:hypothetical protein